MMFEIWLPVVGFEGYYEVSNEGRVKRLARVQLRADGRRYRLAEMLVAPVRHSEGYWCVNLRAEGVAQVPLMHRLVAMAFLPNPDQLPEVNHKDLNRANSRVGNLEWATPKANIHHAAKRGRFHGQTNPNARRKLQPADVAAVRELLHGGVRQATIAERFNVSQPTISLIRNGRMWANPAEVFAHVA